LTHTAGAKSRLNREALTQALHFGDTNYSREELVAEMGVLFLAGHTGIEQVTLENSAAYTTSIIYPDIKDALSLPFLARYVM
jgi:antirestriction protein ArdC